MAKRTKENTRKFPTNYLILIIGLSGYADSAPPFAKEMARRELAGPVGG